MSRENPRSTFFKSQAMALCALAILLLFSSCKDIGVPPEKIIPPNNKPDTTSHDFTFVVDTLGNGDSPSYLKDVAIINDTLVYAVGEMYKQGELSAFSIAIFDGTLWTLKRLFYVNQGDTAGIQSIRGIHVFVAGEVWLAAGSIFRWDGVSQVTELSLSRLTLSDPNATVEKLWGPSASNIYGVGNAGTIVHYDGSSWTKMTSGTSVDLRDVWGSPDGSVVWACGYSNDMSQSVLLKYQSGSWTTVWSRQGTYTDPYGDQVSSLWGKENLYTTSNYGVYRQPMGSTAPVGEILFNSIPSFPFCIRGSLENNVVVVGDRARIHHYNGASWKLLNYGQPFQRLYSVAMSKEMIVAVGEDGTRFPSPAVIFRGQRQ